MAAAFPEFECQNCYDDEVQHADMAKCPAGHQFCIACVRRYVQIKIGESVTVFPCLADCRRDFSYNTIKLVLEPSAFARLEQRQQKEEVLAAKIDDFAECPFCEFGSVPYEGDTLFKCRNPPCMKISCRLCRQMNHLPLKCDEVEGSSEVKARTFIEDKMTDALLRTCNRCSKKFLKDSGCNLMTCLCGTKMCYICRLTIRDHSHFSGWDGPADNNKCPLYSTDDSLHVDVVNAAADRAKEEVTARNPGLTLRHDPTLIRPERTYPAVPRGGLQPRPQAQPLAQPQAQPRPQQGARGMQLPPHLQQQMDRLQLQPQHRPQAQHMTQQDALAMQLPLHMQQQLDRLLPRPADRPWPWHQQAAPAMQDPLGGLQPRPWQRQAAPAMQDPLGGLQPRPWQRQAAPVIPNPAYRVANPVYGSRPMGRANTAQAVDIQRHFQETKQQLTQRMLADSLRF